MRERRVAGVTQETDIRDDVELFRCLWMFPAVVSVQANDDFSLTVAFDDSTEGVLEMKLYLSFGVFKKLNDLEQFKRVRVAFDTVEWECGPDLDPEFVRAKCRIAEKA